MTKFIGSGFVPLSFQLGNNSVMRNLFLKKHEGKEDILKPSDRTLFIVNVPQCFNKKCLKFLFTDYGDVERVFIHPKPTTGEESNQNSTSKFFHPSLSELGSKVSYVVFKKSASLKKVFKNSEAKVVPCATFASNVGKNKWSRKYSSLFMDTKELQDELNEFMSEFDKKIEEEKQKEKELDGEPDEDGWITVSKYSKTPKIPRLEAVNNKLIAKQNAAQSRLSLMKFYKNQLRDAKMEQILELRRKFAKDKAQIALMKSNRKFKPF